MIQFLTISHHHNIRLHCVEVLLSKIEVFKNKGGVGIKLDRLGTGQFPYNLNGGDTDRQTIVFQPQSRLCPSAPTTWSKMHRRRNGMWSKRGDICWQGEYRKACHA